MSTQPFIFFYSVFRLMILQEVHCTRTILVESTLSAYILDDFTSLGLFCRIRQNLGEKKIGK